MRTLRPALTLIAFVALFALGLSGPVAAADGTNGATISRPDFQCGFLLSEDPMDNFSAPCDIQEVVTPSGRVHIRAIADLPDTIEAPTRALVLDTILCATGLTDYPDGNFVETEDCIQIITPSGKVILSVHS